MKIFQLSYVYSNNGETGATSSIDIAQSTNEEVIIDIINKNHLNYVTELKRGEAHVFLLTSWEPNFEPYFYQDKLETAINIDTEYKVKVAEERYEWDHMFKNTPGDQFDFGDELPESKTVELVDGSLVENFHLKPAMSEAKCSADEELDQMTKAFAQALGLDK